MATRDVVFACDRPACADVEHELAAIERQFRLRLPPPLRALLRSAAAGRTPPAGMGVDRARLRLHREAAEHLLIDSKAEYELRGADFVFLFHEYQFLFCPCDGHDDPPVYRFVEGERWPRQVARSVGEWIESWRAGREGEGEG